MKSRRSLRFRKSASSLVTTLLVLVVLSTIVVAFMQSMSVERMTSKNYADRYKATLISDAAVQLALKNLSATTNLGPFATTYYLDPGNTMPYLFQTKLTNSNGTVYLQRYPQFSTLQDMAVFSGTGVAMTSSNALSVSDKDDSGAAVTRSVSRITDLVVNINGTNKTFPTGQIGLTTSGSASVIPVNWNYFADNSGKIVGRYSYWVDDESSKIDVRYAGNTLAAGSFFRSNGTNLNEISLNVLTNYGLSPSSLTNLFAFKQNYTNHFSQAEVRYGPVTNSDISDAAWQQLRPYLTMYSLQDDRAPDGLRKLNLNEIVASTNSATAIAAQITSIKNAISNNIPAFGNRYFQATPASDDDRDTYLTKIAANIRDFIDTDRNATIILGNGTAYTSNNPNFIPYEGLTSSDMPAFGKEDVPLLSEYVRVMRVVNPASDTAPAANLRTLTVRAAHYIELWNLGPKTVTYSDLGPNPFVEVANRTKWVNSGPAGASPSTLRPIDVRIYLPANFTIPAGGYAVLTTDGPPFAPSIQGSQTDYLSTGTSTRYTITRLSGDTPGLEPPVAGTWQAIDAGGQENPTGTVYEDYTVSTSKNSSSRYNLQCFGATSSYTDNRERLLFGNDNGLFDCETRIYTVQNYYLGSDTRNPEYECTYPGDGSSSTINNTPNASASDARFSRGDPRANMETVAFNGDTGDCWKDGQAAYGDATGSMQWSLGASNYNVNQTGSAIARCQWTEYVTDPGANSLIANTNIYSLGQLGGVYDPARVYDPSIGTTNGYRGAGRTLRIGQSDDPGNNRNNNSTAAVDKSWLGGLGSSNQMTTNYFMNASALLNVFRTDNTNAGRINPNAIARATNNPVIAALMDGFKFATNALDGASLALSNKPISTTNVMAAMYQSISNSAPFLGAGDVSRLSIFNAGTNIAGVNMALATVSDEGREEFFRRTANLMASESLSFTITSKAQAGKFRGNLFYPSATITRETTLQLIPTYPANQERPAPSAWQVKIVRDIVY